MNRQPCRNCGGPIIDVSDNLIGAGEHIALGECNQNLRKRLYEQNLLLDLVLRCARGNLHMFDGPVTDYETAFRIGEMQCAALGCVESWIDNYKHGREVDGCPKGRHVCGLDTLPRPAAPDHLEGDLTPQEIFFLQKVTELVAVDGYPLPEFIRLPRDFNHYNDLVRRLVKEVQRRRFPDGDQTD